MQDWASLLSWILALGIGLVWFGAWRRNRRLERWGAQVALSPVQSRALEALWQARGQGPPSVDPLVGLADSDRLHLKEVCSPGFRPLSFGRGDTVWLAGVMQARGWRPA
jgi:hypothetical protein